MWLDTKIQRPGAHTNNFMSSQCVWIGIGVAIDKRNPLYEDLATMRNVLDTKFGNTMRDVFHLNLYDLAVSESALGRIEKVIEEIGNSTKSFNVAIESIGSFPFGPILINLERSQNLFAFHERVVCEVNPLRGECIEPAYLEEKRKYTKQQREMLVRYGNPFVLGGFKPHITVGFIKQIEKLEAAKDAMKGLFAQREFAIDNLNIVRDNSRELKRIELSQ